MASYLELSVLNLNNITQICYDNNKPQADAVQNKDDICNITPICYDNKKTQFDEVQNKDDIYNITPIAPMASYLELSVLNLNKITPICYDNNKPQADALHNKDEYEDEDEYEPISTLNVTNQTRDANHLKPSTKTNIQAQNENLSIVEENKHLDIIIPERPFMHRRVKSKVFISMVLLAIIGTVFIAPLYWYKMVHVDVLTTVSYLSSQSPTYDTTVSTPAHRRRSEYRKKASNPVGNAVNVIGTKVKTCEELRRNLAETEQDIIAECIGGAHIWTTDQDKELCATIKKYCYPGDTVMSIYDTVMNNRLSQLLGNVLNKRCGKPRYSDEELDYNS